MGKREKFNGFNGLLPSKTEIKLEVTFTTIAADVAAAMISNLTYAATPPPADLNAVNEDDMLR